jgi:acyl-CoA synthetase (AMP-forming)/AMP-acid ligase II
LDAKPRSRVGGIRRSTQVSTAAASFSLAALAVLSRERTGCELWRDDSGGRTWPEFGAMVEAARRLCLFADVRPGEVVVTSGEATLESLAWLVGAAATGAVVAPLRRERAEESEAWKKFIPLGWRVQGGRLNRVGEGTMSAAAEQLFGELRGRGHPGLILATGGTTGTPKLVLHDLAALLATVPMKEGRPWRTLPLLRFDHIGGLDVAWRALAGRQVLVAPPAELSPEAVAATIARHRVEVLPATPSFLNLLLLAGAEGRHDLGSLRIVPYGAEPMPAGLLERLRAALPQVEFLQRFGTSETGSLPVVGVGAGLKLAAAAAGFAWKVVDDELWVSSPARGLGYLAGESGQLENPGWFRTGDFAEQLPDGAVRVLGRRADLINVGGEKVLPGAVEAALLAHPDVADCRVFALPNAVLGQVVAAEVVWRGEGTDAVDVKRRLQAFAAATLPKCHLPAVVRLVAAIDTTRNFKKVRPPHS